jgi:hypothetical protein
MGIVVEGTPVFTGAITGTNTHQLHPIPEEQGEGGFRTTGGSQSVSVENNDRRASLENTGRQAVQGNLNLNSAAVGVGVKEGPETDRSAGVRSALNEEGEEVSSAQPLLLHNQDVSSSSL